MNIEDKELLLKDLSARLPYGVKIELMPITRGKCTTLTPIILQDYFISDDVNYLPYLRHLSSMTEKDVKELSKIDEKRFIFSSRHLTYHLDGEIIDYLNRKFFDYHGLIPKGLALEAPEGMYK